MNEIGSVEPGSLQLSIPSRISVLMSVPMDSKCSDLSDALESIFTQSTLPDQLVLVIDGKCSDELEAVIASYQDDRRIRSVEIVRSPYKNGNAATLNAGLMRCRGDWIMCLDANSISHQDRLAIQLDYVARYPDVDVFSSWCHEFDDHGMLRVKSSTIHHDAVVDSLRWRNVLVYPSLLIRVTVLQHIGGYRHHTLEAYDLYVRLVLAGARFRVVPAELVSIPANQREGLVYTWLEVCFRLFCWRVGFINFRQLLATTIAQSFFSLVSAPIQNRLYPLVRVYPESSHAVLYSPPSRSDQCLAANGWSSLPETTSVSQ